MTGSADPEAPMLCLIIFLWDPATLLGLGPYWVEDYARAGLPMPPVTHGNEFTLPAYSCYTLILMAATLLPYVYGMSGLIYPGVGLGS